jgi:hypothetical protein
MTSIAVNEFSTISIARPGSAAILASASIAILAADAISLKAAGRVGGQSSTRGPLKAELLRSQSPVVITDGIGVGRAEVRQTPRERSRRVIVLEEFLGALLDAPRAIVGFSIHRNSPLGRHLPGIIGRQAGAVEHAGVLLRGAHPAFLIRPRHPAAAGCLGSAGAR